MGRSHGMYDSLTFTQQLKISIMFNTATLFSALIVAGAAAASPPVEVIPNLKSGYLRGGVNNTAFARQLAGEENKFPDEYDQTTGCLPDNFKDKCQNCMCYNGPIGGAYPTTHCDLSANPDGKDHCVPKGAIGSACTFGWQCQSNQCIRGKFKYDLVCS